jgi:hypothetical protein
MEPQTILGLPFIILLTAFLSALFFTCAALNYLRLVYKIPLEVTRAFLTRLSYLSRINLRGFGGMDDPVSKSSIAFYAVGAVGLAFVWLMLWLSILANQEFILLAIVTLEIAAAGWWSYSLIRRYRQICKQYSLEGSAEH